MPLIATHELEPGKPIPFQQQVYCGLDTTITFEVLEAIQGLFNEEPPTYSFARALQAPALEMMLRGFRVDEFERQKGITVLKARLSKLQAILNQLSFPVWDKPLNARSPKQLIEFFYRAMHLPEIWTSKKGVRKLSMDREALEKLEIHFHAMPIVATILGIRENSKRLEVLETEVDLDGRMRTSYNIAGTETGRWSSSSSSTGSGTNLQNVTAELRNIFIPDPGYILVGFDLEQAESREVGWKHGVLFNDWTYYNACLAGDLHTTTAKLVWPDLGWTGEAKADRALAEQPFYRHFSYRDMAKRGGHGTSYYGTPFTMARHLKVPQKFMVDFQAGFFTAYPAFKRSFQWTAQQLQTTHVLTTYFGRERQFFGRPGDDTTLREAIAFEPQSTTADRLNLILWRIWKHMGTRVQILAQVHDAFYFQVPLTTNLDALIPEALSHFDIPISHSGRTHSVPGEAKVGFNWGNQSSSNPDGLRKWRPGMATPNKTPLLERIM